jgi:cytochrome c-type biogenesis protein CcmH/NrfF
MRILSMLLFLLLACAGLFEPAQVGNLVPPPMPRAQADLYKRIASRVLAPCCWSQPVETHQSPEAERVRAEIVAYIHAGLGESQIQDRLATEYGERILGEPRGIRGSVAILVPVAVWIAGLTGLCFVVFQMAYRRNESCNAILPLPEIPEFD